MHPNKYCPGASAGANLRSALNPDMTRQIQDEFTDLAWPKWKKRQARLFRDKRCQNCSGRVAYPGARKCLKHLVYTREYQRQRRGNKRRYWSASYKLQDGVNVEAL